MFMQLGFRDGLFDTSVTIHKLLDADLVLISLDQKFYKHEWIPKKKVDSNLAVEDVVKTAPVNLNYLLGEILKILKLDQYLH